MRKIIDSLRSRMEGRIARFIVSTILVAGVVILRLALVADLDFIATYSPHDDAWFVAKSLSFKLNEECISARHLAAIKEPLWPWILGASRSLGIPGFLTLQMMFLGATYWLAREGAALFGLRGCYAMLAWVMMAFMPLSHMSFAHATYDGLFLIMHLAVTAAGVRFIRRSNVSNAALLGMMVGLGVITRPEGALFLVPAAIAVVVSLCNRGIDWRRDLRCLCVIFLSALMIGAVPSVANWSKFGFFAPTIMKAGPMQEVLCALMAIDHGPRIERVPVTKAAISLATECSPTLASDAHYWQKNFDGRGWSMFAPAYADNTCGNIVGAHTQWAVLDVAAAGSGTSQTKMLNHMQEIADELENAFQDGRLQRRTVVHPSVGPHFSPLDAGLWRSVVKVSTRILAPDLHPVRFDTVAPNTTSRSLALFDRGLLRRHRQWPAARGKKVRGWITAADGSPSVIGMFPIDDGGTGVGVAALQVDHRPDVRNAFPQTTEGEYVGFSFDWAHASPPRGALSVVFADSTIGHLPLHAPLGIDEGGNLKMSVAEDRRVLIHRDPVVSAQQKHQKETHRTYRIRRSIVIMWPWVKTVMAMVLLAGIVVTCVHAPVRRRFLGAGVVVISLVGPLVVLRAFVLGAIDRYMYSGTGMRYIAPSAALLEAAFILLAVVAAGAVVQVVGHHQVFRGAKDAGDGEP